MLNSHLNPNKILAMSTLLLSTIMILSSSSWLFMWVALEINLISFIPLMMSSHSTKELSSSTMYFLIQAISSPLLLFSTLALMYFTHFMDYSYHMNNSLYLLLLMSLMMKMGGSPCHFWLPKVMNNLTWPMIFLLTTWQKIPTLTIMSTLMTNWTPLLLSALVLMNAAVGGSGGLNQTHMRPLLAYSSISHLSWMLMSMLVSAVLPPTYFIMYSVIMMSLATMLNTINKSTINQFNLTLNLPLNSTLMTFLVMLSLAGLPPLTGFMPKLMILNSTMPWYPELSLMIIVFSLMPMYYYLTLFMGALMSSFKMMKTPLYSPLLSATAMISTTTFPLLLMF